MPWNSGADISEEGAMVKQTTTSSTQAERLFQLQERYVGVAIVAQVLEKIPGTMMIHIAGYIDSMNINFFQRYTSRVVEAGFTRLALDLRDVSFVSSTGIGSLVGLLRNVRALGGSLVLVGMQPRVLEVVLLLGFASFFELAKTTEEAVALMKASADQTVFPKNDMCPICGKRVRLTRSGRFRCPQCKVVLTVDRAAVIRL